MFAKSFAQTSLFSLPAPQCMQRFDRPKNKVQPVGHSASQQNPAWAAFSKTTDRLVSECCAITPPCELGIRPDNTDTQSLPEFASWKKSS